MSARGPITTWASSRVAAELLSDARRRSAGIVVRGLFTCAQRVQSDSTLFFFAKGSAATTNAGPVLIEQPGQIFTHLALFKNEDSVARRVET